MNDKAKQRLSYIDWMRGLACLTMFQTHCYDSWLADSERSSQFFKWSQLVGTLPAPLFLFLAGVSFALVTDKMRRRGTPDGEIARTTIKRGAEIFGIAILFRIQEFILGQPWAPWTDLLRVDILNMMGISMMAMGVVCRLGRTRASSALAAIGVSLAIALATPPLWTTLRPRWLPWPLESYINGVHTYPEPQPWLFPIFPWSAIAFAGLAAGFVLFSDWAKQREALTAALLGAGGAALYLVSQWLDAMPVQLYSVYDYWHTNPNFFLARIGILLMILFGCHGWCRWGAGEWGFSPMIQLGQTSLLVYWVHIEFVYGRFSILPKRGVSIQTASLGLLAIFAAMLLLSMARTRLKGRGAEVFGWFRRMSRPAQEG
ncbi:MAG: DUF1624 domain-containing protein [Acidobacteria bacterium]|nr:DUF1624 domain-containing protein [Acidobacteriota bacterium]MBI3663643.1 DUF1624 domain-containing protein [Acidobacteriota bacterium]